MSRWRSSMASAFAWATPSRSSSRRPGFGTGSRSWSGSRSPAMAKTIAELTAEIAAGHPSDATLKRWRRDKRAGVRDLARAELLRRRADADERARLLGMLEYEHRLWGQGVQAIAGLDEAGAGPLAGPVVAAAVILRPGESIAEIDD